MTAAREAIPAAPADHVSFTADNLAWIEIGDVGASFDNFAHKFMAHDHRHGDGAGSPVIPFVNVQISAANAGPMDTDEDVVDANSGLRNVFEPEAGLRFIFNERFH